MKSIKLKTMNKVHRSYEEEINALYNQVIEVGQALSKQRRIVARS